jgi:ATP-binding cassette, subfamily B, bacterial
MKRVPFVRQMETAECGLACICMLLRYHGRLAYLDELRTAHGFGRDGMSLAGIVKIARAEGLVASGFQLEPDSLRSEDIFPSILHWNTQHFVVAERATKKGLVLADPAVGRYTVTWKEVDRSFTGLCLKLVPGEDFRRHTTARKRKIPIEGLLHDLKGIVALVVSVAALVDAVSFVVPGVMGAFIDYILPAKSHLMFVAFGLLAMGVALVHAAVQAARVRVMQGVRAKLDQRLSSYLFTRLASLNLDFFLNRRPFELASRIHAALSLRDAGLAAAIALFDGLLVVTYVSLLFAYSSTLALTIVAGAVLRLALSFWALRALQERAMHEAIERARLGGVVLTAFSDPESTQALRLDDYFASRFDIAQSKHLKTIERSHWTDSAFKAVHQLVEHAILASIVLCGGWLVQQQRLTLGALTCVLAVHAVVSGKISSIGSAMSKAATILSILERLEDIVRAPQAREGGGCTAIRGGLELRDVVFKYSPTSHTILNGLSIVIRPGEHVALVGASGQGKSTILRLMAGLIEPTGGEVSYDGKPLAELCLSDLRRQIGYVPPVGTFFDGTVRSNVALETNASDDAVWKALRQAGLGEFMGQHLRGLDTPIDTRSSKFSTGQKQRLLLARALVKNPAILFLDEATSALDAKTESAIIGHLRSLRTTIVSVTHRPEVMRASTRIVVLEDGRVINQGSFSDLLVRCPLFRALVAPQFHDSEQQRMLPQ